MNRIPHDTHLDAEAIQAFLDGGLPGREQRRAEEHLAGCGRCASRVDAWRELFSDLDGLPRLVPHEGFQARVMSEVEIPEPRPLAARVGAYLKGLLPSLPGTAHPGAEELQELAEGVVATGREARLLEHVDGCGACARELSLWRELVGALDGLGHLDPGDGFAGEVMAAWRLEKELDALGHLAPSEGFAARVMAGVRIPDPATAPATAPETAPATAPAWERLLAAARRLVPGTRRAWAALSGVAVTPVVTVGLVVWTVFSHPTLTPSTLASFAWWQVSELGLAAWTAVSGFAMESAGVFQTWDALAGLVSQPGILAAVALTFAAGSLVSLWILYKNLIANHTVDGRYAHAHL